MLMILHSDSTVQSNISYVKTTKKIRPDQMSTCTHTMLAVLYQIATQDCTAILRGGVGKGLSSAL